uniref:Uncharacterized protein n=1 Tax=viral metagenome TaxID=1070528 RepID=A0A6H2A6B0_9ZZZZ
MKGTIVDCVKMPADRGGGNGYIVKTDDGKLELWSEEALEFEDVQKENEWRKWNDLPAR